MTDQGLVVGDADEIQIVCDSSSKLYTLRFIPSGDFVMSMINCLAKL